jgi:hypothetical protein
MEADISTLRKTGHFYFALTRRRNEFRPAEGRVARLPLPGGVLRAGEATIDKIAGQREDRKVKHGVDADGDAEESAEG